MEHLPTPPPSRLPAVCLRSKKVVPVVRVVVICMFIMEADNGDFNIQCDIFNFTQEPDGEIRVEIMENPTENGGEVMDDGENDFDIVGALEKENFEFVRAQKAGSTVRKTERDTQRFIQYLQAQNEENLPEALVPKRLNTYISSYLRNQKRLDGTDYEPDSITSIYGSIDRYLREKSYPVSIMDGGALKNAREMVEAKRRR